MKAALLLCVVVLVSVGCCALGSPLRRARATPSTVRADKVAYFTQVQPPPPDFWSSCWQFRKVREGQDHLTRIPLGFWELWSYLKSFISFIHFVFFFFFALNHKQKVDHFNPEDQRTWKQKYLIYDDNYNPGGPIFCTWVKTWPKCYFGVVVVMACICALEE